MPKTVSRNNAPISCSPADAETIAVFRVPAKGVRRSRQLDLPAGRDIPFTGLKSGARAASGSNGGEDGGL
jgi:hypothetical protein